MKNTIVKYSELSGYSKLFLDFNYNYEKLSEVFGASDPSLFVEPIRQFSYPRKKLTDILMRQNKNWNASEKVIENINKLNDDKSVVVTAGQQACLFGGPYLILLKMLTVLKRADLLESQLGIPVIPLFWIASDDHDFAEISKADIFDIGGDVAQLSINVDSNRKYPPVGSISFDDSIADAVNTLKDNLPENDFKKIAIDSIMKYYKTGENVVDAFARYWLEQLGHFGIVMVNPYDEGFKELCAPFMTSVINHHSDMKRVLHDSNEWLVSNDYHLQVQKPESSAHMFAHLPERTAIRFRDNKFVAGDRDYSSESLAEDIDTNSLNYSPDVFTRPLMQSYLFPVLEVIGGPSEIAYFAQSMKLFELFTLPRPKISARLSATFIENKYEKTMESQKISFNDVVRRFDEILKALHNEHYPESIKSKIALLRKSNNDFLRGLQEEFKQNDFDASSIINKYTRKFDYLANELDKKLENAFIGQSGSDKERLERMRRALMPYRDSSERSISLVYFMSRYGKNVIDFVDEKLNFDSAGHQIIYLSEYHG